MHAHHAQGYSLIELSICLVIIALLAGGLLGTLGQQRELAAMQEAQRQLDNARDTLLAYAMTQGRLPCPARANLPEGQADAGREDCSLSGHGVLPWATLGLPQTDPWGMRYTYYAHSLFTAPVTAGTLASFNLASEGNANIREVLGGVSNLASALPAVIVSHGPNRLGGYLPSGQQLTPGNGEEAENANADLSFIAHARSADFDDQVSWINSALLKARLVAAGRLP